MTGLREQLAVDINGEARDKPWIIDPSGQRPPIQLPQVRDLVRLTPEVYADLEKRHTRLSVSATSTPIEVAFQLGVQSVLRDLRAGYVVAA